MKNISTSNSPDSNSTVNMDRKIGGRSAISKRTKLISSASIVILLMAALYYFFVPASGTFNTTSSDIEIATVKRQRFDDYLALRAEVQPRTIVTLTSVAGGQVDEILAADGADVVLNQPLARLNNHELRLAVSGREVEIASQISNLSAQELALSRTNADIESQLKAAQNEKLRADQALVGREFLYSKKLVSDKGIAPYRQEAKFRRDQVKSLRDDAKATSALGSRQLAQNRAAAQLLRNNLRIARAGLDDLIVRAPIAGILSGFELQPGQTIAAGDSVGQIFSTDSYKVSADVDEFYLSRVSPGQTALATINGRKNKLTVTKILPQVNNGRFRIELQFDGISPSKLRRGQTLDVRLTLGDSKVALVVPAGSWADSGGLAFVASPSEPDLFKRRQLRLGRRNPEQVEVLSGLIAGERIITSSTETYVGIEQVRSK